MNNKIVKNQVDENFINQLLKSNAWPFLEAQRLLNAIDNKLPSKGYVLFETGYGPSGLPHIGTFAEVARTSFVISAFRQISSMPVRLFCFSDDMDGLRKVPTNLPNQEMIALHLGKSLTSIPDPFGVEKSFGHYMNAKLCSFLDKFGFEYEFLSSTKCYKEGVFDEMMIKVLENYEKIMDLMLPTFRSERRATYSPFMPICPETNIVLQVAIEKINKDNATVSYRNEQGELVEASILKGGCKLQWKPDFGMRWAAFDVNYEMYGKDLRPNEPIYTAICKILGGRGPVSFFYEMFLDENGEKISKSKGNSISIDQWLNYAPLESLALFIYQSPQKAKRLYFEVIPKAVDEYLTLNKKFHTEEDEIKKIANPVYHIHKSKVPKIENLGLSFSLLLNLAIACNPDREEVLWGYIIKYAGTDGSGEDLDYLQNLVKFAIAYYNDFIKNNKDYLKPNEKHKEVLGKILLSLDKITEEMEAEEIQKNIYDIGMEYYEDLHAYFQDIYQILLGQKYGPRLGTFIKLFGIEETRKLIKEKL